LQDIRLRGAEIGFVGVGCAPCDNILPSFADKTASGEPVKILVFNQRDSDEAIRQKLAPYNVECPVFVPDSSEKHLWGDIYGEYGIQGLPTTVSIDGECVIAAHRIGMLVQGK
jgi:hypothetical protein